MSAKSDLATQTRLSASRLTATTLPAEAEAQNADP